MSDNELQEFREFEDGVRKGLGEMAGRIHPSDRLDAIVTAGGPRKRSAVWLVSAAAVFILVAALGIGYLIGQNRTNAMTSTAGAAGPAEKDQAQPQAQSVPPDARSASSSTTPLVATNSWAMPVYWVVTGTPTQPWLLNRTFVPMQATADRTGRVQLAVTGALNLVEGGLGVPYAVQQPWQPGTTASVAVTDSLITVTLNQPGRLGLMAQQQKVAVQSLVWTATAAAQLTVPVRVEVTGGRPVFATMPAGSYSRPGSDLSYTDLVPIWIDVPGAKAQVSSPVTVTGEACVFEAQFAYELLQGSTVVKQGGVTASIGCPTRGTYSIPLGTLAAGSYTIRVYDTSMKDGSVSYETRTDFTVS